MSRVEVINRSNSSLEGGGVGGCGHPPRLVEGRPRHFLSAKPSSSPDHEQLTNKRRGAFCLSDAGL